ncbi:hypothetical protein Tco_1042089 [Tanacetum coccineum]|uniref:Uncharacterized protein n=1 Tax=Tanacetum coccineum TaxID=301880 RepID=A0ABQ5GJJ8_9ASTR
MRLSAQEYRKFGKELDNNREIGRVPEVLGVVEREGRGGGKKKKGIMGEVRRGLKEREGRGGEKGKWKGGREEKKSERKGDKSRFEEVGKKKRDEEMKVEEGC